MVEEINEMLSVKCLAQCLARGGSCHYSHLQVFVCAMESKRKTYGEWEEATGWQVSNSIWGRSAQGWKHYLRRGSSHPGTQESRGRVAAGYHAAEQWFSPWCWSSSISITRELVGNANSGVLPQRCWMRNCALCFTSSPGDSAAQWGLRTSGVEGTQE